MPTAPAIPLDRARVLAVDDHPTNLQFLAVALDGQVAELRLSTSGSEAVEAVATAPCDLVLMDLHLTDMDGIEAWRRIQAALDGACVPKILALTADTREQTCGRVRAAGFDGLLGKPVERAELLQAMSDVLAGASGFVRVGVQRRRPALLIDDAAAIRATGGPQAARALQAALADELQRELPEFERWLCSGAVEQAAARLHRWRGACGYAGARGLDHACRQLEQALEGDAVQERATALVALLRTLQASVAAIRAESARDSEAVARGGFEPLRDDAPPPEPGL